MKIKQNILAIALIVLIFGTVAAASLAGYWQTDGSGSGSQDKYKSSGSAGEYLPADIKGSYTLAEVGSFFRIPAADLAEAFGIAPADLESVKCKDLSSLYETAGDAEIGPDSVRVFASLYTGLPYTLSDTVLLPSSAEAVLLRAGAMTEEQKAFVASHTFPDGREDSAG